MKKNSKKPCYGCGGKMEEGGYANPPGKYWNGSRYVEHKGSGTYNNGVYFGKGGPADFEGYYPPKQQPGYWKVVSPWDSGVLGNIQYGGYITPSMDYQPHILKETNGQRHMAEGGHYIPAPIDFEMNQPRHTGYQNRMEHGGYIPASINYHPEILKSTDGQRHMADGGYYQTHNLWEDQGHIAELQGGGYFNQGGMYAAGGNYGPGGGYPDGGMVPGDTDMPDTPMFKKGGIHIKPENKGKFTAWAKSHGMGVQEAASHVLANKGKYSSTIVKRANFAHNAAGWKHQYGGVTDADLDADMMKKGGNWIKGAVNPAHKGYCTPMTKSTCTPRRKAFAMTMKKHHGFHEYGGPVQYAIGGFGPDANGPTADEAAGANALYTPQQGPAANPAYTTGVVQQAPEAAWRAGMTDEQAQGNINAGGTMNDNGSYGPQKLTGRQKAAMYGQAGQNLLGAGLMAGAAFAQRKANKDERSMNIDRHGSWNMAAQNQPGGHGNYNQYGNFRPNEQTYANQGMYLPGGVGAAMTQYGGQYMYGGGYNNSGLFASGGHYNYGGQYADGGVYDIDDKEIARLKAAGYNIEHL